MKHTNSDQQKPRIQFQLKQIWYYDGAFLSAWKVASGELNACWYIWLSAGKLSIWTRHWGLLLGILNTFKAAASFASTIVAASISVTLPNLNMLSLLKNVTFWLRPFHTSTWTDFKITTVPSVCFFKLSQQSIYWLFPRGELYPFLT